MQTARRPGNSLPTNSPKISVIIRPLGLMTCGARALPGPTIRQPHYLISVSLQGVAAAPKMAHSQIAKWLYVAPKLDDAGDSN